MSIEPEDISKSNKTFFSAALEPEELEHILTKIDENLEFRSMLFGQKKDDQPIARTIELPPTLPGRLNLSWDLEDAEKWHSLLYFVRGWSLPGIVKRLFNLPLKIFGAKQILFNQRVLHILKNIDGEIQNLRVSAEYQPHLHNAINQTNEDLHSFEKEYQKILNQQEEIKSLVEEMSIERQKLRDELNNTKMEIQFSKNQSEEFNANLNKLISEVRDHINIEHKKQDENLITLRDGFNSKLNNQRDWLKLLEKNQKGLNDWLDLVNRKLMGISWEVREVWPRSQKEELPEPRILDPHAYDQKIAAMGGVIKVNLGSGEKPLPGYINIDFRQLPDVDIVADVRRLPYEPGTLAEIASAHLVEHFREYHFRTVVLPYWKNLLSKDGVLRIICPNWAAMFDKLKAGEMSLEDFKLLTFGAQDYDGDDHFTMYTPETLIKLLSEAGFERIEVAATDRINGICPEMEVLAYP